MAAVEHRSHKPSIAVGEIERPKSRSTTLRAGLSIVHDVGGGNTRVRPAAGWQLVPKVNDGVAIGIDADHVTAVHAVESAVNLVVDASVYWPFVVSTFWIVDMDEKDKGHLLKVPDVDGVVCHLDQGVRAAIPPRRRLSDSWHWGCGRFHWLP